MKKEKIGVYKEEKQDFINKSYLKLKTLQEAISIFLEQTKNQPIENIIQFEKDFLSYAINFVKQKHKEAEVLKLQDFELCRLYGYDFSKLIEIQEKYKNTTGAVKNFNGVFDIDADAIDFNIYAETPEELDRLKDVKEIIEIVNKFHSKYFAPNILIQQMNFFGKIYILNDTGTKIEPNFYFIKQ